MAKHGDKLGKWLLEVKVAKNIDHVWHVTATDDGTLGVLKMPRGKKESTLERFRNEVDGLRSLTGMPGVLPILDCDRAPQPRWFVMPPAEPLDARLADADFEVTVSVFAQLAETLARLKNSSAPVAHRDVKPDNLFCHAGDPVFADFGIAKWPASAGVTNDWEKVGPMTFLAPEAMWAAQVKNWHAADVYSLTKSLWALAAPRQEWPDRKITFHWPPPGQISDIKYSLKNFGGSSAEELDPVIEQATSDDPAQRPTAEVFAQELRSWLRQHPGSHPRPPEKSGLKLLDYRDLMTMLRQHTATAAAALRLLVVELRAALDHVETDETVDPEHNPRGTVDPDGTLKSKAIMSLHGRDPRDEWDGSLILRIQPPQADIRLILGVVIASPTDMDIVCERHHRQPDGAWVLHFSDELLSRRPGFPSTAEQLRHMIASLTNDPRVTRAIGQTWMSDRIL